jgi:hypothetical protein
MILKGKAVGKKLGRMTDGSIFCVEGGKYNFRFNTETGVYDVEDEMDQVEADEGEIKFGHEMPIAFFDEHFSTLHYPEDLDLSEAVDVDKVMYSFSDGECVGRCDGHFSQAAERDKHVGPCMSEYKMSECHDCFCRLDCLVLFLKENLF